MNVSVIIIQYITVKQSQGSFSASWVLLYFILCIFCYLYYINTVLSVISVSQNRTLRLLYCTFCCVTVICFLLLEGALVLPLLFDLGVLTVAVDPLLPERLDVLSVVDLRQVHLQQQNNTDRTNTLIKEEHHSELKGFVSRPTAGLKG